MQAFDIFVDTQRAFAKTIMVLWFVSTLGFLWGAEPAIMEIGEEPGVTNMEALLRKNLIESNDTYVKILKVLYVSPVEIWSHAYNGWSAEMANEIRRFTGDAPELLAALHTWLVTPLPQRVDIMKIVRMNTDFIKRMVPDVFGKTLSVLRDEALASGIDVGSVPRMSKSDVEVIMRGRPEGPWHGFDPNNRNKHRSFYTMVADIMRAYSLSSVNEVQSVFVGGIDTGAFKALRISTGDAFVTDDVIQQLPETHTIRKMYEEWPLRTIDADVAAQELTLLNAYLQVSDQNTVGWMYSNSLAQYMRGPPDVVVSTDIDLGSKGGTCLHMSRKICTG